MSKSRDDPQWSDIRNAVFTRDRYRCANCPRKVDEVVAIDPDHVVPRGVGGSDRLSNILTLCRQCHAAKHGDGLAPTVRVESSGDMTDLEFLYFKQFVQQIVPAMARTFDVRIEPKFGLADRDQWHLPLGDLVRLDRQLLESDCVEDYASLKADQYM